MADEAPIDFIPPFEHVDEDEDEEVVHTYQTQFKVHPCVEETVVNPRSIMR